MATPPANATGPSQFGLDMIKNREGGFVADAYDDAGGTAIGYGMHTFGGKPVTPGMHITEEDALKELREQVAKIYAPAFTSVLRVPINQNQFDALLSVAWNAPKAAKNLALKLNKGVQLTLQDFLASATVDGKPHPGLISRRTAEYKQFTNPNF